MLFRKARKILNYKTTISLEDSIQKVVDYVKANGPKNLFIIMKSN